MMWSQKRRDEYYESLKVPLVDIYIRDHGICHLCEKFVRWYDASRDHIKPRSEGGRTTFANIKLAHMRCNSKRASRPVKEFKRERLRKQRANT